MAESRQCRGGHDQCHKNPDQVAQRLRSFNDGDDLTHHEGLSECGESPGSAENDDERKNPLVLEQKRHELTKSGSW